MIHLKWISFFVILAMWNTEIFAQRTTPHANVYWGEETKEPPKSRIINVLGADANGYYAVRLQGRSGNEPYLEYYNHKNKLKKSKEIDVRYKGQRRNFKDIIFFNGKNYLLTTFTNTQKKTKYLFIQDIDTKSFDTKETNIRKIGEVPSRVLFETGSFDYRISEDSTHLMVYHNMPYKRNEAERFAFKVYDKQMKEVWSKEVALPFTDQLFEVKDFKVDDAGNAYLLGKLFDERVRERKGGKPNYKYLVLAYLDQGTNQKQYKISFEEKFISELTFKIAKNGDLICAGFYSDLRTSLLKGTCFFKINAANGKLYNSGVKEFDQEFLSQFMSERKAARGKELYSYDMRKLILRSDGGAVLVAEQYFVRVSQNRDANGRITTRYYYNYNDIIVININPDGSIAWANKIPKRQVTVDDGGYFSSFAMATVRDKLYFIFNDNPANSNELDPRRILNYNGKRSVVTLAILGAKGSYEKYSLFSNQDADVITRPKVCKQTSRNEMVIYGERRRNYRFGKVKFK